MADISPVKTWTNETLTPTDLNAEFSNVYTNHCSLGTAQTVSGRKTFSGGVVVDEILSVAVATGGVDAVKVADIRWDPATSAPANSDSMYVDWVADDASNGETVYGRQLLILSDVTAGQEDGNWQWGVAVAGTVTTLLTYGNGGFTWNGQNIDLNFTIGTENNLTTLFVDGALDSVGVGTNAFGAGSQYVMALANGTQAGTVTNAIQVCSEDLTAGNTIPSIRTEGTGIWTAGTPDTSTGALALKVNGTVYYIPADTDAPTP